MPPRVGPGPVFWCEVRAAARRRRGYLVRMAFVAALLVLLGLWWWAAGFAMRRSELPTFTMAHLRKVLYQALAVTQLMVALLAAPAAAADALGRDRGRGVLGLLLVSPLSAAEIV